MRVFPTLGISLKSAIGRVEDASGGRSLRPAPFRTSHRTLQMPTLLQRDLLEAPIDDRDHDPISIVETFPGVRLAPSGRERRRHRRYAVRPMYAAVRVWDGEDHIVDGHLLDISIAGARFESDRAFEADERLRFEIELPGGAATLRGLARVVRQVVEHEALGDMLVAVEFERFDTRIDGATLTRYLEQGCLLRAA